MERWTCPACGREFGRPGQGHSCSPGLSLDEYFATAQPWERPIYDIVAGHLQGLGDVIIDPISIGILFKNGPTFCQLRAMKRWTALGFDLGHKLTSDRLSRKVIEYGSGFHHIVNIDDPGLLDDELLDWLTEAYHTAGGTLAGWEAATSVGASPATGSDPMVPDDVDDPFA